MPLNSRRPEYPTNKPTSHKDSASSKPLLEFLEKEENKKFENVKICLADKKKRECSEILSLFESLAIIDNVKMKEELDRILETFVSNGITYSYEKKDKHKKEEREIKNLVALKSLEELPLQKKSIIASGLLGHSSIKSDIEAINAIDLLPDDKKELAYKYMTIGYDWLEPLKNIIKNDISDLLGKHPKDSSTYLSVEGLSKKLNTSDSENIMKIGPRGALRVVIQELSHSEKENYENYKLYYENLGQEGDQFKNAVEAVMSKMNGPSKNNETST